MKGIVFIRVDGSSTIGLGHVVRCFALAQMLMDDFEITFFCKQITDSAYDEIIAKGLTINRIENEEDFINKLNSEIILVLDGYHFDTNYQKKVKETGCKLVCIDDLHDKEFFADLIINHTPGINPEDYVAQPYTKFALGLDYVLLRPSFLEQAKKERIINKIENVMICFGGSDPQNKTQQVLSVVIEFPEIKKIIVVTGSGYKLTNNFIKLVKSDNRIEHRSSLDEKAMLQTMLETELAIVPSSGILLEALCCNMIPIICQTVTNQKKMFKFFVDHFGIKYFTCSSTGYIIESLRNNLRLVLQNHFESLSHIAITLSSSQNNISNIFKSFSFK